MGSNNSDSISVAGNASSVSVTLDGVTRSFNTSGFNSLLVQSLAGADSINFNPSPDDSFHVPSGSIDLGSENDNLTINGTALTPLTILAGAGDDILNIDARAAYGTFDGGTGTDQLNVVGTAADDNFIINASSFTALGHTLAFSNAETLTYDAKEGNNTFTINSVVSQRSFYLRSGSGNDAFNLVGGGGNVNSIAWIYSGSGDDTVTVNTVFTGHFVYTELSGDTGVDTLVLEGSESNDTWWVDGANRAIYGGSLSQSDITTFNAMRFYGHGGRDSVFLTLRDLPMSVSFDGGDDVDFLMLYTANLAQVSFLGGAGDDQMTVSSTGSHASFDGGPGNDLVSFLGYDPALPITITATSIFDPVRTLDVSTIESIRVTSENVGQVVNIVGTSYPVDFEGGTGPDTINVGSGNLDALAAGRLKLWGGGGIDTLVIDDHLNPNSGSLAFFDNSFTRTGLPPSGYQDFENVTILAGSGSNSIRIRQAPNPMTIRVDSGDGDDTISFEGAAPGANITILGGPGNDGFSYTIPTPTTPPSTLPINYIGGPGNDTVDVSAGTMILNNDLSQSNSSVSLNINANAAALINVSQHVAALTVQSTGRATLASGGSRVLVTGSLQVSGTLDLNDNALIVNATTATRGDVFNDVHNSIKLAYTSPTGNWQSGGLTSSAAAANAGGAVGVILNSTGGTNYSVFGGENVDGNSIIVAYTSVGDLNLDRAVTISDFIDLAAHFNLTPAHWGDGDINFDNAVTIADFIELAAHFGQTVIPPQLISAQPAMPGLSSVPAASEGIAVDETDILDVKKARRWHDRRSRLHLHHARHRHKHLRWQSRVGLY
jgi:hypothetical protein